MTIELRDGALVCAGTLAVDDAEALLQHLLERPVAAVAPDAPLAAATDADLGECVHVHSACLQVLMAARVRVTRWPADAGLADWLRAALNPTTQP